MPEIHGRMRETPRASMAGGEMEQAGGIAVSTTADGSAAKPARRILIVDDEPTVREVVGQYLALEGYAIVTAADGLEALRLAAASPPDLVILDLMLPGIDGIEVCRRLRAASAVPILMLTARTEDLDKIEGFEAGTDDYITKPFRAREVVMRVRAIMRRLEAVSAPAMVTEGDLRFGGLVIRSRLHQAERDGQPLDLTAKEFDLLRYLASHPGQVCTRHDLLRDVWNYEYFGDGTTVTVHMRRLREKVEYDPARPSHLRTVWGVGYRFEP
ncbi:MAG TPA: response regulator transcription factor [Ktedonobacterales bacterium]